MDEHTMMLLGLLLTLATTSSQYSNATVEPGYLLSNPCTDRNHLVLAPGVLAAGGTNRACISRFHPDGPAKLVLTLVSEDRQTITASRDLPPGDGGCLDINVPQLPNTKAEFIVNVKYPDAQCTWERRMSLRIAAGRLIVVHTERARYHPGDTLRLRILALKPDLTPSHGLIDEAWLEGPRGAWEGARITQWLRLRTRLGLAQLQYQIDELAPPGKWTVRAKMADGAQGSAVFWVGNYELPPFQLSVRHAPRILRSSDRLVWTVCVRYPWSEAVEGMLVIRLRGAGGSGGVNSAGIRTAVQLRAPKACHRHAAASRRIGLNGTYPPDVVIADFSFQEEGTRIWQNTTVVSQVVDKPITLEFLTKHRAVISPGLPYKLKVKATRWDEKPATNVHIRVCRYPALQPMDKPAAVHDSICADGIVDTGGVARLLFAAGNDAAPFYRFEASLSNDTSTTAVPLTLAVRRTAQTHAALGPLKADSRVSRTFVPLYLNMPNITTAITVHFVVITRGGVIYRWGATTQCPITNSADQIRTSPRNSRCNANIAYYDFNQARDVIMPQRHSMHDPETGRHDVMLSQSDASANITQFDADALLDRHLLRVMLPIKVSHQMCPDSHLIAYFYYNGEFVSANKHFEMDECFASKVETTWLSRQVLPGSTASLRVSTPGPALCALTVLDTATKWTQPLQSVKEVLMGGLRKLIDSHRNLTEYDAAGDCFLSTDTPDIPSNSIELTSSWLAAAGVRLLGGDLPAWRHCEPHPPASLVSDEGTTPRTDFSEAWLWRLLAIGMNGTGVVSARAPDSITRFEASAFCISRNGVAISPPAVLQVFREFFIHADSPKRLRRGDTTIIRYRIFNYLYEPLSVEIQILTDPHMQGPEVPVESACVSARAAVARRAEVRARAAGPALLRIYARANSTGGGAAVSDEVVIRITVEPEGVPVHEQKSILLCGNKSAESRISQIMWNWPPVVSVPGTETLNVWAAGDVTGPLLADADSLVVIPRGCGEQNMAQLATNLLALNQLDPTSVAAGTAREHVSRGFTRQLQYVHPTGGFSAFGPSDASSSTWLTAFAVKHMRKAHRALWPNLQVPPALIRAERWLLSQQMENGCFRNEGQVFHRELRGGLNEEGEIANVALTAYVITSLLDSTSPLPFRVVRNTLSCLRALPPLKSKTPTRVYAHALLAYAYVRLERYEEDLRKTNEANFMWRNVFGAGLERDAGERQVQELLRMARRNGDYVWWEASSLSTSIEATAYTLLALYESAAARERGEGAAAGARRWLAAHRGATGGFVSTQDTLVALEALTAWSSLQSSTPANLTVTARCSGLDKKITLQPGAKIPEVMKMRPGEKLSVAVEGTGCALVQATRSYNTLSSDGSQEKQLSVQVSVHTDGPFDCENNGTSCFCAAVVETCVMWSGAFPEMALLEVALPGGFGADAALLYSQLHTTSTLLRRIELTPTNTRATFYLGTRDGSDTSGHGGHQCFSIHAVGPTAKTRPAYARVQDYYRPVVNDTQAYTIPEDCPPRIAHQTNEYRASDNLFNKARSLSDSGEIVITHEFSFEDIPEGIPLEDPLYENLTKREKDEVDADKEKDTERPVQLESRTSSEDILKTKFDVHSNTSVRNIVNIDKQIQSKYSELSKTRDIYTNHKINGSKLQLQNNLMKDMNTFTLRKGSELQTNSSHSNKEYSAGGKENADNSISNNITKGQLTLKDNEINSYINAEQTTRNSYTELTNIVSKLPEEVTEMNKGIDNPNLSSFHVIDTEKDLEVPLGLEGPVPAMVLPPDNFVPPPKTSGNLRIIETPHGPYYYLRADDNMFKRQYFIPMF